MADLLERLKAALADRCSTDRHVIVSGRARVFLWDSGMNRRCSLSDSLPAGLRRPYGSKRARQ